MALPTSTIVMALLTAVPFGLAIKDTVTGTSAYDARSDEEREKDEALEALEREYEDQQQQKKVDLEASLEQLIPTARKAIIGLPGYDLGQPTPEESSAQARLERVAYALISTTKNSDAKLNSVTISFPQYMSDENICLRVSQRLEDAWGSSSRTYGNSSSRKHWATTSPQQRATFIDPDGDERCAIVVEEFAGPLHFVTKTEASVVPLWAIGKSADKLAEKLGPDAYSDDTQIRWTGIGYGEGYGGTELYARSVKGKIVTVTAKFQTSAVSARALVDKLVADHGEPTVTDPAVWEKSKLSLATLDDSAGEYLLVAGAPLPDEE